jgi:bacterial/archaeal transporter family-2 protein
MNPVLALMAFAIGVVVPLQAAINNQLKLLLDGSTVLAAMISFAVGTISLTLLAVCSGQKFSGLSQLARGEWWMFLGGLLGAFFVFGTTLLAPRLGVATMLSLIIAGQVCTSLLFDRFGWLSMPLREVNLPRLLGALLVVAGVLLVNFGDKWFGR